MIARPSLPAMPNPLKIARRLAGRARRLLRDRLRGETDRTTFDLFDLRRFNDAVTPLGVMAWARGTAQASRGETGALRFILTEYAARPDLRRRHPRGLTERTALRDELVQTPCLSADGRANVAAAFEGLRGERAKRVYDMRQDLRAVFLFGLTPHPLCIDYVHWFIHHGSPQYGVSLEEVIWCLYEEGEATDRGLVTTYLGNPEWQRDCPDALTIFGWDKFKDYLSHRHQLAGRWFDRATLTPALRPWDELTVACRARGITDLPRAAAERSDTAAVTRWVRSQNLGVKPSSAWLAGLADDIRAGLPARPGVNVIAHFRYPSGLQEAALGVDRGLRAVGARMSLREIPVTHACDWSEPERYRGTELYDTTVFLAAINTAPADWIPRAGVDWRAGVRRIAYWYWELDEVPADWRAKMQWPDEVWAPTRFLADAFRKVVDVPVIPMLPGLELPPVVARPRSYFGLPEGKTLFLFSFDMSSVIARKNPHAVIDAFRRAFTRDDAAHLVIKVSRGETRPDELLKLRVLAGTMNATVLNATMTRADTLSLLNLADCYVSLHRAEGLGLGMAESMLLGKPVVATNYSGNTDFMTPDTAWLVDYDLVPVGPGNFPYPETATWAEANVEQAAGYLREIYDDPAAAKAKAERGREHVRTVLDPEAFGRRMLARLMAS
jgi:glycosyltransferase involved in cell wall biosynthesis